jgi:hypothetical protein
MFYIKLIFHQNLQCTLIYVKTLVINQKEEELMSYLFRKDKNQKSSPIDLMFLTVLFLPKIGYDVHIIFNILWL